MKTFLHIFQGDTHKTELHKTKLTIRPNCIRPKKTFEICSINIRPIVFLSPKFDISKVEIGYVTLVTFLVRSYEQFGLT